MHEGEEMIYKVFAINAVLLFSTIWVSVKIFGVDLKNVKSKVLDFLLIAWLLGSGLSVPIVICWGIWSL